MGVCVVQLFLFQLCNVTIAYLSPSKRRSNRHHTIPLSHLYSDDYVAETDTSNCGNRFRRTDYDAVKRNIRATSGCKIPNLLHDRLVLIFEYVSWRWLQLTTATGFRFDGRSTVEWPSNRGWNQCIKATRGETTYKTDDNAISPSTHVVTWCSASAPGRQPHPVVMRGLVVYHDCVALSVRNNYTEV